MYSVIQLVCVEKMTKEQRCKGGQYLEEGLLKLGFRGRKSLMAWLCHMELEGERIWEGLESHRASVITAKGWIFSP